MQTRQTHRRSTQKQKQTKHPLEMVRTYIQTNQEKLITLNTQRKTVNIHKKAFNAEMPIEMVDGETYTLADVVYCIQTRNNQLSMYTQKVNEKGLTALKFNERKKVKSWISGKDPLIDLIVPSSSVDMRIEDIVAVKDELGKERMEVDGEREVMLRVEHALEEDNLLDALDGLIESAFFGESMKEFVEKREKPYQTFSSALLSNVKDFTAQEKRITDYVHKERREEERKSHSSYNRYEWNEKELYADKGKGGMVNCIVLTLAGWLNKVLTTGSDKTKKKARRGSPIIIVPKMNAPITIHNARDFITDGIFAPPHPGKQTIARLANAVYIDKMVNGRNVKFKLMDSLSAKTLSEKDFKERVVAVITQGVSWQFKQWKISDPATIFASAKGFYIDDGRDEPPSLKGWNVDKLTVSQSSEHQNSRSHVVFWDKVIPQLKIKGYNA